MFSEAKGNILAIIPARSGSKRIPNKNIRNFLGRPLIYYTIKQALSCSFIDRVIVDTDSEVIAQVARKYGADVPFLRPPRLAQDNSRVVHTILYTLNKLKRLEGYEPEYTIILQTTSPLREIKDIEDCWNMMKATNATTVLTVCPTHPRLYYLNNNNDLKLVNRRKNLSTNMQDWRQGYILNGCFVYIVKTDSIHKERSIITKRTKAVVCPRWRSIDLDTLEEWAVAELFHKHKKRVLDRMNNL